MNLVTSFLYLLIPFFWAGFLGNQEKEFYREEKKMNFSKVILGNILYSVGVFIAFLLKDLTGNRPNFGFTIFIILLGWGGSFFLMRKVSSRQKEKRPAV